MNSIVNQINKNFYAAGIEPYFDYTIRTEDNADPNYFIYVRSAIEPSQFKQLLAYIQFYSFTRVSKKHTLTEVEIAKVINAVFIDARTVIMKTTMFLKDDYTEIKLLENYKEHHRKRDSITYLIDERIEKALITYLNKLAKKNGWVLKYDYLIQDENNIDPAFFLYVRSEIESLKFKQLLAFIQYTSKSHVSKRHVLSEFEVVSIINDFFGHVEILKTTVPLKRDYTQIKLLENYESHWKCPDEIFYLVESIGENVIVNALKDLAITNVWSC
ncbi:hypothetical protein [Lysinibacillus xylanilyticus]|uniref:Uncharacterized protein n=1 Tax=Lysinibacillus xylanilyticus TaxID=582475 RepID=A0A2M9QA23_9BACI|nr:hypothetical protein [Lysinibacillus xylanilyticus]PJO44926.1 hypothetical protein CWD94_04370 [Lysinibacillus xylanilyticus]